MNIEEDPITIAPHATGPYGRLWRLDQAVREARAKDTGKVYADAGGWLVEAPWAHPLWHSYIVTLVHLRDVPGVKPAMVRLPGATHEFIVWAADPSQPRQPQIEGRERLRWLEPANFVAQLIAESDAAAHERIEGTLMLILTGELSPDTDFRSAWTAMFGDHMLKRAGEK